MTSMFKGTSFMRKPRKLLMKAMRMYDINKRLRLMVLKITPTPMKTKLKGVLRGIDKCQGISSNLKLICHPQLLNLKLRIMWYCTLSQTICFIINSLTLILLS